MATYKLAITVDDKNINSLRKKVAAALGKDEAGFTAEKIERNQSRADRLGEAESMVDDAKSVVEELKDELQSWRDSLPENLQGGDKASQLDDAISALEDLGSNLEQCEFSVDFPSMMG